MSAGLLVAAVIAILSGSVHGATVGIDHISEPSQFQLVGEPIAFDAMDGTLRMPLPAGIALFGAAVVSMVLWAHAPRTGSPRRLSCHCHLATAPSVDGLGRHLYPTASTRLG